MLGKQWKKEHLIEREREKKHIYFVTLYQEFDFEVK